MRPFASGYAEFPEGVKVDGEVVPRAVLIVERVIEPLAARDPIRAELPARVGTDPAGQIEALIMWSLRSTSRYCMADGCS